MSRTHTPITEQLSEYIRRHWLRPTPIFERLQAETAQTPNPSMQTAAEQGQFLQFLVRLMGARRALEIGVFTGHSSLAVALAMPPDGRIIACDVSDHWTSIARRYWREAGVEHKVDLRLGPALATLDQLLAEGAAGTFDFAFIDADKMNNANYYERALQLVRPGGVIAIDNVLWHGRIADESVQDEETQAMRAFNLALHGDERIWLTLVPLGDALTLALKK
jgi:predicted O-methyltransferase YrrM